MCRHTQYLENGKEAAWGYDYPLQAYFFQLFDVEGDIEEWDDRCTNGELLEHFDGHGVTPLTTELLSIISDLPCCPRGNSGKSPAIQAFLDHIGPILDEMETR